MQSIAITKLRANKVYEISVNVMLHMMIICIV